MTEAEFRALKEGDLVFTTALYPMAFHDDDFQLPHYALEGKGVLRFRVTSTFRVEGKGLDCFRASCESPEDFLGKLDIVPSTCMDQYFLTEQEAVQRWVEILREGLVICKNHLATWEDAVEGIEAKIEELGSK